VIVILCQIKRQACVSISFFYQMLLLIPDHFITVKSEASFVNTQVITDTIQSLIKKKNRNGI